MDDVWLTLHVRVAAESFPSAMAFGAQLCEELEDKWSTDHGTNESFVREAKVVGD